MKSRVPEVSFDPLDLASAVGVIAGKWKVRIICLLLSGTKRFSELHRLLSAISRGTLSLELRQLQRDGIIDRTQFATIPPTVEYKLTAIGQKLKPILAALDEWSKLLPRQENDSF